MKLVLQGPSVLLRPRRTASLVLDLSSSCCAYGGRRSASVFLRGQQLRRLSSSISYGPAEPALLAQTIPEHFASVVGRYADRTALIARAPVASADTARIAPPRETVYTYGALDLVSDALARGLRDVAGVQRGDRVAVSLGNGPEFAVLTYAIYKLGAVLVPLNPAFTAAQVSAALAHLGVRLLIMGAVADLAYKPGRGRSNLGLLRELAERRRERDGGERPGQKSEGERGGRGADIGLLGEAEIRSAAVPTLERIVLVDNTADHPAVAGAGDFAQLGTRLAALTPFSQLLGGGSILRPDLLVGAMAEGRHRPGTLAPDLLAGEKEGRTGKGGCDDVINIQFTSGTTSHPKAAMLSHRAILNNGALIGHQMGLRPTDRVVCPPPLFHCFGSVLGYMATATTGAALLLPSPAFDPAAALQMAADHRATGLYGVSTMFVSMLELMEQVEEAGEGASGSRNGPISREAVRQLPGHLRTGIAAGSSVPEALMRRLQGSLGLHDLVICYGMTETAPVSAMTTPADPPAKRTASCGRAMPHTAIKIVDPLDRSRILPRGSAGEIAVSGYLLMDGYYGEPERTAEVLSSDSSVSPSSSSPTKWMHSGDEGIMDADGFVAVTGRIKDLIIRGGENIHPLEIENCLLGHSLVADVSVVGVPDARHGEAVAAFVVPHAGVHVHGGILAPSQCTAGSLGPVDADEDADTALLALTADDVRSWVRRHLSAHLVPRHVLWIDDCPKTASGKIQKFKLRALAKQLVEAESLREVERSD